MYVPTLELRWPGFDNFSTCTHRHNNCRGGRHVRTCMCSLYRGDISVSDQYKLYLMRDLIWGNSVEVMSVNLNWHIQTQSTQSTLNSSYAAKNTYLCTTTDRKSLDYCL